MSAEASSTVKAFITAHRAGRLATADGQGTPHVVPICYAYDGHVIYSAIDLKPKRVRPRQLKRIRNIITNPKVALIVDGYNEDWSQLAYVSIQGEAAVLEDGDEREHAEGLLRQKYAQYEKLLDRGCPVVKITPTSVASWGNV